MNKTYWLMVNHYKISFRHELMKRIELMFEYHFVIHYVFELDNDVEHYDRLLKLNKTEFLSVATYVKYSKAV
jgi:hypothetical protein